ncbi:MAG TPA: hypothetical protein DCF88_01580 [Plesiomonas shigelloides]|nr:hypothetical protein [Plesiomonas shigelloides]
MRFLIVIWSVFALAGCADSTYYVYVPKCTDSSYRTAKLDKYISNGYLEVEKSDAVAFTRENIMIQDLLIEVAVDNISNANNSNYKKKHLAFNHDGSYITSDGLDSTAHSRSVDVVDEATKLECYNNFRNSLIKLMGKVNGNYIYP